MIINSQNTTSKQKTLAAEIIFSGVGLHSGKKANVKILPDIPSSGITFIRSDLKSNNSIKALWKNVSSTVLSTTITNEHNISVATIEHLMGAFHGMGIDTGVDLEKLIETGRFISDVFGRLPQSRVSSA